MIKISHCCYFRRPVAQKVRDIGVWFDIMETLGKQKRTYNGPFVN